MNQKRLLLLSNSTNPGTPFLSYPTPHIGDFLGQDIKNILFIPYAAVGFSYDAYEKKVQEALKDIGYHVKSIHHFADPVAAVEQFEAIAVGGGNTFHLLHELYRNDLLNIVRSQVERGIPYIGWSAGSNVAGPSIKTTNDMPIIEPPSFEAFNLVPFQINPHYTEESLPNHGGETRPDRINEFITINPDVYVAGIPEGNMLRVEGDSCELIGTGPVSIFRQGQEKKTIEDKRLDWLL